MKSFIDHMAEKNRKLLHISISLKLHFSTLVACKIISVRNPMWFGRENWVWYMAKCKRVQPKGMNHEFILCTVLTTTHYLVIFAAPLALCAEVAWMNLKESAISRAQRDRSITLADSDLSLICLILLQSHSLVNIYIHAYVRARSTIDNA